MSFDYRLPPSAIALTPARPRDAARLLCVNPADAQPLRDSKISALPEHLQSGDVLVVNDTKVLPTRLVLRRASGGRIEANLVEPVAGKLPTWKAFLRPSRRLREDEILQLGATSVRIVKRRERATWLEFACSAAAFARLLRTQGTMPLPPYIASRRAPDAQDKRRYQTVFASHDGAVAAPTAGLHFTKRLLQRLARRKVRVERITLHVGAGTFLPPTPAQIRAKRLHAEWGELSPQVARRLTRARKDNKRIVAVGTTTLRVLERAVRADRTLGAFTGEISSFMMPGFKFRASDMLLTNFHLPRTSLLMLVCAYSGTACMRRAYAHALARGFRFYSYGDACLLRPC